MESTLFLYLVNFSRADESSIYYVNLLPLMNSAKNLDNLSSSEVQTVIKTIYHTVLGLPYASVDDRLFYLKSDGSFAVDGNITISVGDLILPQNLPITKTNTQGKLYKLNINGSEKFSSSDSGYSSIAITGKLSILENDSIVYTSDVSGITLLAKVSALSGYGHIEFDSLTASYPYRAYSGETYDYTGKIELAIVPLSSNGLFLIYPFTLGDF